MTTSAYFVSTDDFGVERLSGDPVKWTLPKDAQPSVPLARPDGVPVVLRTPIALLDALDDVIWVVESVDGPVDESPDGTVRVHSARLVRRTRWDPATAALFALDCAEHAIGAAGQVKLPNGHLISEVISEARDFLTSATAPGAHLGLLARIGTIRRLKRENEVVSHLAFGLSIEDINADLDTTLDAAWTSAASVADSLFAALEAIRHQAFPHYVHAREAIAVEQSAHSSEATDSTMLPTPWGNIVIGGEHESPYLPAAIAAQEAALRARESVRDRDGVEAEAVEREWQAARLAETLS